MPALDATTTAMFASIGISGATVYGVFGNLINQSIAVTLWLVQTYWLPLLALLAVGLLLKVAGKFLHFGK